VLEALRRDFGNQWTGLTQAVAWVATERGFYPALQDTRIVQLDAADEVPLRACAEQLIAEGVLALGINGRDRAWARGCWWLAEGATETTGGP
jgi:hypothetical protein